MISRSTVPLLLVTLVTTGCAIDRGALPRESVPDARVRRDAGPRDGGRLDARPRDAGSSDVGPPSDTGAGPPARVDAGIVALYTFEEGSGDVVHDVSGVSPPLDLWIESTGNAEWGPGTLTVTGDNRVRSGAPATKIIDRCVASDELTVEVWYQTDDANQGGPARVVTLSVDALHRNFTLGHDRGAVDFRLRRAGSDASGQPSVPTPSDAVTTDLTHYVFVRRRTGEAVAYQDGVPLVEESIAGDFDGWDDGYELALANELEASRLWLGTYYLVALYSRALSEAEVATNFAAGPD